MIVIVTESLRNLWDGNKYTKILQQNIICIPITTNYVKQSLIYKVHNNDTCYEITNMAHYFMFREHHSIFSSQQFLLTKVLKRV